MEKLLLGDSVRKLGVLKLNRLTLEGPVFRLHYKVTSLTLIAFSIMVSGYQFFGKPIMCIQKDDIPEELLNTFCWVESTFTLPKAFTKIVGSEVVFPGVDKYDEGDEVIEHAYYQWVCFMLILQAGFFYAPRLVWKALERGRIKGLLQDLNNPIICEGDDFETRAKRLVGYIIETKDSHLCYAMSYFLCEILNFVNVIVQMYFTNKFIGGYFTTYGIKVVEYANTDQDQRYDPMIRIFPRISKCAFHKFGSSGDVQKHDALCLLPLNIVNEKIYVFLWFWFIILAILSGLTLVYYASHMVSKKMRIYLLKSESRFNSYLNVDVVVKKIPYGCWFLLYMLGGNIESVHLSYILRKLEEPKEDILMWTNGDKKKGESDA